MEVGVLDEPIRCKRGQTYDETFTFKDENGAPINVASKVFALSVRENELSATAVSATCTLVGTDGVRVVIAATATALLKVRTYKTDLRATEGTVVDYMFEGDFIVEEAITRS